MFKLLLCDPIYVLIAKAPPSGKENKKHKNKKRKRVCEDDIEGSLQVMDTNRVADILAKVQEPPPKKVRAVTEEAELTHLDSDDKVNV